MRALWFLALLALLALAPLSSDAQLFGIWRTSGGGSFPSTVCYFGGLDLTNTSVDLTNTSLTLC
jgi:hypothetical protein